MNFFFRMSSRLFLEPTQPPFQWVLGAVSPWVKQLRCEVDHTLPISAEVTKTWIYTLTPHMTLWQFLWISIGMQINSYLFCSTVLFCSLTTCCLVLQYFGMVWMPMCNWIILICYSQWQCILRLQDCDRLLYWLDRNVITILESQHTLR
jgi:hypothetical protein